MTFLPSFPDLQDTSVLITGGGSGIGAVLTEAFLRQNARVAFIDIADATGFAEQVGQDTGNDPMFLRADVTDTDALDGAVASATARHGPIDILVNNAANDERHKTMDVTPEYWDWAMGINLKSYFFACKAVLGGMRARRSGAIVNFSSISYMMGNAGYPAYTSANAAITGMTRSLAREFGPDGVRVNAIAPGWVLTEKQKALWATPEALAGHLDRQCLKEHMVPEDIAGTALFLASHASRMITGQTLAVDGGVVVSG